MNRRSFLHNAMLGAAALVVDPERLLWTPGKKTIFIPKPWQQNSQSSWELAPSISDTTDELYAGMLIVINDKIYRITEYHRRVHV